MGWMLPPHISPILREQFVDVALIRRRRLLGSLGLRSRSNGLDLFHRRLDLRVLFRNVATLLLAQARQARSTMASNVKLAVLYGEHRLGENGNARTGGTLGIPSAILQLIPSRDHQSERHRPRDRRHCRRLWR